MKSLLAKVVQYDICYSLTMVVGGDFYRFAACFFELFMKQQQQQQLKLWIFAREILGGSTVGDEKA